MKKRDRLIKKDNVILLPDLEKRLLEKGLDRLERKHYQEAIEFLSDARELDPDNVDVYIGLVLAYFEMGNLQDANALAKEMLQSGIGEYFQVVDLYIMILVQQHHYEEIILTIEALLEEKEVPTDKLEHFTRMLEFSRKMVDEKLEQPEESFETQESKNQLNLFSLQDPKDQIHVAAMLSNKNVRFYINEITDYLLSLEGQPFFKTMLLNVLKEQEYEKEVTVTKFGLKQLVIPINLFEPHLHPDYSPIYRRMAEELENDDPVLLENITQLMDRYFFLLYPFRIEPIGNNSWAAAFHYTGLAYLGLEKPLSEFLGLYECEERSVSTAIALIGVIEEFSSP